MNTTTRTAIRFYAHMIKVIGWKNTDSLGIVHFTDGSSELWSTWGQCLIDREPTEVFLDKGLDADRARAMLVGMLKQAIARVEKLN